MLVMNYEQKINDCIKDASKIMLHQNGKTTEFLRGQEKFNLLLNNTLSAFENSRIMPAFGVSLHAETVAAMQTDDWIEIVFSTEQTISELPFSALLFRLDEAYGINLIREHNGEYSGRCIYLDFDTQKNLREIIKNI